jgi:hypothetical protein
MLTTETKKSEGDEEDAQSSSLFAGCEIVMDILVELWSLK